jgi:hypothetical protein
VLGRASSLRCPAGRGGVASFGIDHVEHILREGLGRTRDEPGRALSEVAADVAPRSTNRSGCGARARHGRARREATRRRRRGEARCNVRSSHPSLAPATGDDRYPPQHEPSPHRAGPAWTTNVQSTARTVDDRVLYR